ncbi:uncharacterized protein HMPREF1541_04773 [Cyphellophora europaea CBS 101466]|uniref:GPI ethanolamine phosphate transferase 2 n=1 Tax=Cyphellophora europaea (strain CBS 101466) TaxID=1220924 RepID=W2RVG3_CYPE1|nr:uncharacterized protein HMPREF1541_04773 [Cyphellophora europaea CBS 101466]ETN40496.1 hypothetical protein HMPREF1541_04773 [Cyphellophora europaea CBS 101466]
MPSTFRVATILLANALLVAAIAIFAAGFFPYKAFIPGLATWQPDSLRVRRPPPFNKVVFMVVDALRSDFVYGNASNFHFTQSLVREGAAIPFTGHASPPTITMPRVKAITTGSVPSFVDLVLNFAESDTTSTLATQDSWLAQLRAKGTGNLLMYGDDTWLRLFPGFFDRADGTTSFFVSDFTEVDNNVTRHVDTELKNDDWTAMTFHYLGLDHIGHKTGPGGPNMPAKQAEMDGIVKRVYQAIQSEAHLSSTLLVLLGDHGMNEAGNHGANSAGEVSTALTFISPKLKNAFLGSACPIEPEKDFSFYRTVEQSDLAPTLAAFLDFPVPLNNLGRIIPRMLALWSDPADRYSLLYENARQISRIAHATFPKEFDNISSLDDDACATALSDAQEIACLWTEIERTHAAHAADDFDSEIAALFLDRFLRKAQNALSGTASNYDTNKLLIGSIISLSALVLAISPLLTSSTGQLATLSSLFFLLLNTLYAITMFASSYVEEEHQFWYWFSGLYLSLLTLKTSRFHDPSHSSRHVGAAGALALTVLLSGLTKRWRTTGQKYAGAPSLLTTLVLPNPYLLWTLIFVTYSVHSRNLSARATSWLQSRHLGALPVLVSMSTLVFKIAFTAADAPELVRSVLPLRPVLQLTQGYPLLNLARLAFFGLVQLLACAIYYEIPWRGGQQQQQQQQRQQQRPQRPSASGFLPVFHDVLALFLIMQTRTENIPLFLVWYAQVRLLEVSPALRHLSATELGLLGLVMQFVAFFAMGGTNAISSVDLSSAYNGVGGYNVVAVGVLTFAGNWAGPVWWSVATARLLVGKAALAVGEDEIEEGAGEVRGKEVPAAGSVSRRGEGRVRQVAFDHFVRLTVFAASSTCAVMVACFVLREHLFIWTVFSPKYLYMVAWVLAQHLIVNGLLVTGGLCLSRW